MEEKKKSEGSGLTLQILFVTKQEQFSIADTPYLVEANIGSEGLNSLVNKVLLDDGLTEKPIEFDFLIGEEFLRGTLEELVLRHEALKQQEKSNEGLVDEEGASKTKIGVEEVIEIEYVERTAPPEPEELLMHDDWVSAVDAIDKWILTGAYDGTLHLWTLKGKHKLGFSAHSGPIKAVCWVACDPSSAVFASGSHDQTIMIWEWNLESNKVSCKWVCKGHKRSVDSLRQDPTSSMLASGSWDGELKIWSGTLDEETGKKPEAKGDDDEEETKNTRTPIMTLGGHKESISSVCWSDPSELMTASWDHTIKLWDVETGGMKSEVVGNKAFFGLSWSSLNNTAITCSADRHIRLYDPRSKEGSLVKALFTSHSGWVSTVNWSTTNENLFISGSHDKLMKLWDRRSPRAPLYNMTGHTDKVLCSTWANPELIMGGGTDNTLRIFRAKDSSQKSV